MGLNIWKERDELRAQLTEAEVQYQSLLREFERHRRHSRTELESADNRARAQAAAAFLPVYDQLTLALQAQGATDEFMNGVRMTLNQFLHVLEGMNIHPMDSLGKKFDPQFHEAVDHAEQEGAESDDIIEVIREGFFRPTDGAVIRHAMVRVAK